MEEKEKTLQEKLSELVNELERQKKEKYDVVVPSDNLIALKEGNSIKMDVPILDKDGNSIETKRFGITNFCHNQISEKTGIPMKYYRKMIDNDKIDLLADNINTWFPDKEKRFVRTLDGNIRALLSDRYRVIDNYDIFNATLDEFKHVMEEHKIRIEIKRADLTEQHLYIKATSPDLLDEILMGEPRTEIDPNNHKRVNEPVEGGIIIRNSEVGSGAFSVQPFINVLVCQNGLIRTQALRHVHLGRTKEIGEIQWSNQTLELEDATLWSKIKDMVYGTFNPEVFHSWIDEINKVASNEIPKPTVAVDNIIKKYEIPKGERDSLLNQFTKESPTQWGLSMAVTRVAQDMEDYEKQVELEKIGARILEEEIEALVKES